MSNRTERDGRGEHLQSALIFLVAWVGVVYAMVGEFEGGGGLAQIITKFKEGNYTPVLLLSMSIILLALLTRSFTLYFRPGAGSEDGNSSS